MNQADIVRRYLRDPRDVDFHDTGFPFITLSRQAGTDAHAIGRCILKRLTESEDPDLNTGWDLFDQKLCALIVQNTGLDADFNDLVNETHRPEGLQHLVYEMLIGTPQQFQIQKKIDEVMRLLARLGKVVLIGRAGFHLTRGIPGGIHILLVAPMSHRVHALMEQDRLAEDQARQRIRESDEERSRYLKKHYGCDPEDPAQFDLICNVATLPVPEIVEAASVLARRRWLQMRG